MRQRLPSIHLLSTVTCKSVTYSVFGLLIWSAMNSPQKTWPALSIFGFVLKRDRLSMKLLLNHYYENQNIPLKRSHT